MAIGLSVAQNIASSQSDRNVFVIGISDSHSKGRPKIVI